MRQRSDSRLHAVFFAGLSLSAGCATYESAPPDTTPRRPTPTASGPISDPSAVKLASEYKSADPQKGLSGMEIVGVVNDPGLVDSKPTCSKMPCDAEWLKLADRGGNRVVIMRRDGKLSALTEFNFKEVLGPLDTPEKVALRMQIEDDYPAATCGKVASMGLACAEGSNEAHPPVRAAEGGGFEVITFGERNVCPSPQFGAATALGVIKVSAEGELTDVDNDLSKAAAAQVLPNVDCRYPSRGRMFEGFEHAPLERCELEYFLRAAREEAAAVIAFERLARELAYHGAPASLVEAARKSADDERRHARMFRREAERVAAALGIELLRPERQAAPAALRSLMELLLENAREGCANETYAAIIATHQATHAPSPRLATLFASIADDERDHAILAHRIHAWGLSQLDDAEQVLLATAFDDACSRLLAGAATPLANAMGEPRPELARVAFRHVMGALLAA